jgi:hypothetical protein
MNQQRDPGTAPRAARFSERPVAEERRVGEVVGAAAALLVLVVGVPLLLLWLDGAPPVPTSLPGGDDLTQPVTTGTVVSVLVAVVWLVWLLFLACVVVEVVAGLRGGLARQIPLGGPLQQLARVLVGALLLAGVAAGPAAGAATSDLAPATPAAASSATTMERADGVGPGATATSERADARAETDPTAGKKVYTVKAPKDGYHDNLWDIADRHLGDGRRYKEIYQLNQGRAQADGRSLQLARLIQPGWELIMPEDAVDVPRLTPSEAPATPAPDGRGGSPTTPTDQDTGAAEQAPLGRADRAETGAETAVELSGLVGGGLLAAGIIGSLALQRRRRLGRDPDPEAAEAEVGFRIAATTGRAAALDRTLRQMAARCVEEHVPVPSVYAAVLDDTHVELLLAPGRTDACSGWEVLDEGRRWRAATGDDPEMPQMSAPYPALVSLGVDESGRDVLVDLEAAGGMITLVGATHVMGEVAAAIAVQAAASRWGEAMQVTASGLAPELDQVGDGRVRLVEDLTTVLPEFEAAIGQHREGVLTGRVARRGGVTSQLVVATGDPAPEVLQRLAALTGAGRQAFSVVVTGDSPAARWRLHVDDSGVLTVPALDLQVVANRISQAELDAVAELFAATRETSAEDGSRPAVPVPERTVDDAEWATAPRRVGVVGPLAVDGLAGLDDVRHAEAREIIAYLALHPGGVHPHVLAGAVWPRGVTEDVRDAVLERAMAAFGTDPEGRNHLRRDPEGRYQLGPDVVCDWDALRRLLLESRRAPSPRQERDLLGRALTLVRGEPLAGRPPGRYAWAAAAGVERSMRVLVVDAADRLAQLCLDSDDPDGARSAAADGLRLEPTSLLLWRHVLRSADRAEGTGGVRQAVDEMGSLLEAHQVPLDPETEALVDELLPDLRTLPASG